MAKDEIPFANLLYKECVRRLRERHEVQFVTVAGMTGVHRLNIAHKFEVDGSISEIARSEIALNLLEKTWKSRFNNIIDVCKAPFEHTFIETDHVVTSDQPHRIQDSGRIGWLLHRMSRTTLVECAAEATDREMGRRAGPLPLKFIILTDGNYPLSDDMKEKYHPVTIEGKHLPRLYYSHSSASPEAAASMIKILLPPLLGLLAMINVVPTVKSDNVPKGSHLVASKIKPYFRSTKIILELPLKRAKKSFNQMASGGWNNRRHLVRGHFRTYTDAQGNVVRRTWIEEHLRGDATLGWVNQEHQVVSGDRPAHIDETVFQTPLFN